MSVITSILFLFCSWLFMINVIVSGQQQGISESNNNSDNFTLRNQPSDKTLLSHDESFITNEFESKKTTNISHMGKLVPVKVQLLQQLNPINIFKPLQEKIDKVKETLQLHASNNVQFWSTDDIWDKVHQSGHKILTGINNAIFGVIHPQQQDYPFPYRRKDGLN